MADIIITVVSGETTELGLAIPGVQGPIGGDTMPSGGVAGDILVKQSATNYDASWTKQVSGITVQASTLSGTITNSGTIAGGTIDSPTITAPIITDIDATNGSVDNVTFTNAIVNSPTISGTISTGNGLVIGTASGVLGFYGASAVARPSGIAVPSGGSSLAEVTTTVSGIVVALQALGLLT